MGLIITYVKLGWRCNTNCIFCAVGGEVGPRELPTDVVVEQLRFGRQYNATILTISGGEPTIRHDLPYLIETARQMGFTGIQVQTNGRALASEKYCAKLLGAGATKFIVSLHGHTDELHDRLTQIKGSFAQTSQGIKNLTCTESSPPLLQTNTTVVTDNYKFLPEIVQYLEALGVSCINLSYVQPSGAARQIMDKISPRMTDVATHIKRLLQRSDVSARVAVDGIPPCLLAEYRDLNCAPKTGHKNSVS